MLLSCKARHHLFCIITTCIIATPLGCAQKQVHISPTEPSSQNSTATSSTSNTASLSGEAKKSAVATNAGNKQKSCLECAAVDQKKERSQCYKLQPGTTTKVKKGKKFITVKGRCQPQSLIYARCRSGFDSCRLGDTSPVGWFYCAQKSGETSAIPVPGSLMIIGAHKNRGMPTGHIGYVEEVCRNSDGTYTLRFSHTNYDRQCHLDLDAKVIFDPKKMEANFTSGYWQVWAKNLKILGFIIK